MTNSKSTKRALLLSALSILMCVAMLVGTTFAWFTDTASTAVNKIQAGTLDVALEMFNGEKWVPAENTTLDFVKAAGHTNEAILWEPGCTYNLPELRIVNNGNLALKYKVVISGINGDAKLNEAIDWTIGDVAMGTEQHLAASESSSFTISGHMKETAGNEYQGLTIDGIAITVYATQDTVEYDSTTNEYDKNATLPDIWDGTSDAQGLAENTDAQNKTVIIENAAQLAAFATNVKNNNTYFGYTVTLENDIDLGSAAWSGVGANSYAHSPSYFFNGTFDGQGHTIYNMTVSSLIGNTSTAGFFNGLGHNAIVKNINFENASVTSNHQAGVVAGYCATAAGNGVVQEPKAYIENCNVNNSAVVSMAHGDGETYDDGDKAGCIIGYTFFDVKNCSVKNTTITGYRDIGGIVGYANSNDYSTACITGNTVENVTIYVDKTHDYKNYGSLSEYDANTFVGEKAAAVNVSNNEGTAKVVTTVNVVTDDATKVTKALKADTETINVTLTGDVEILADSGTQWTNASGGKDTSTITIDGQGKYTLTFRHPDSDGNHVATNGAELVLKNLNLTNSGYNDGPWNRHDIVFDCKITLENVNSDKAIAFGADATINNVIINENGDVYALWITANAKSVTLNKVTINCPNGRAIAIKDQYVHNSEKVTLSIKDSTISSAKKAAVLVTNKAGATINADNVDISGVASDSTNLVWVDNGTNYNNIDDVTVTGGSAIVEP